jgi:hypothetical protein
MPWADPVDPYVEHETWESFVTVRHCAEVLNMTEDQVIELAKRGTLRTRGRLVQPALIPGYTT